MNNEISTLINNLLVLDGAKKHYPSVGGQMLGCELYTLKASGFSFQSLYDAAYALKDQQKEIESLKAGNKDLQDWFDNLKADYDTVCKELELLKSNKTHVGYLYVGSEIGEELSDPEIRMSTGAHDINEKYIGDPKVLQVFVL